MAVDLEILKTINYFNGLDNDELKYIKNYMIEKNIEKGEILLTEGGTSNYIYFVVSGLIKVYKSSTNGKEQILHIAPPGDSLNDVQIFGGESRNAASIEALTPVVLYAIQKDDLKIILHNPPKLVINIFQVLAKRIGRDAKLVGELSSTQALGRLAKLLLGKYAGEEATIGSYLNQREMANMIGVSRERVNRSLKELEDRGAIRLHRHKVIVMNRKLLNGLAKEIEDSSNKKADSIDID
jgi:CRP-like cAMP-binding protein